MLLLVLFILAIVVVVVNFDFVANCCAVKEFRLCISCAACVYIQVRGRSVRAAFSLLFYFVSSFYLRTHNDMCM